MKVFSNLVLMLLCSNLTLNCLTKDEKAKLISDKEFELLCLHMDGVDLDEEVRKLKKHQFYESFYKKIKYTLTAIAIISVAINIAVLIDVLHNEETCPCATHAFLNKLGDVPWYEKITLIMSQEKMPCSLPSGLSLSYTI
jgi:hypothetical protein